MSIDHIQRAFDAQLPEWCFAPDETTEREALEWLVQQAAKSASRHLEDGFEATVSDHVEGMFCVTTEALGVTYATRRQLADAHIAFAAAILAAERKAK